mmetsp:Transcript_29106/g.42251  ORF Transcript_29106/g.42251 Transcript_29106/m.42251 type:complete len:103 (+) Transcript_29106:1933-2241(+)
MKMETSNKVFAIIPMKLHVPHISLLVLLSFLILDMEWGGKLNLGYYQLLKHVRRTTWLLMRACLGAEKNANHRGVVLRKVLCLVEINIRTFVNSMSPFAAHF